MLNKCASGALICSTVSFSIIGDIPSTPGDLVVEHLENKNAYVRSVFIDFSSAFNTLKPDIVIYKLRTLNVSPILCKFILDFLTNREQTVRI